MILDAKVIVAHLDQLDRKHYQARALVASGPHTLHMVNMGEIVSVIYRRFPRDAEALLEDLYGSADLEISDARVERVAGRLHSARSSSKISLADCMAAALAMETGDTLATADGDLRLLARSHGFKVHMIGQTR